MLSVDPPDDDDSDDGQPQRPTHPATTAAATTTYAIKARTDEAGGNEGTTNHIENGEGESKTSTDVIVIDGDHGDAEHANTDKESPTVIFGLLILVFPTVTSVSDDSTSSLIFYALQKHTAEWEDAFCTSRDTAPMSPCIVITSM